MPSNKKSPIRFIGDSILHRVATPFPSAPSATELDALQQQITIAKKLIIKTGGAGIAANQCAEINNPYQMIIVGVVEDSLVHLKNVTSRYPEITLSRACTIINPKIIHQSKETTTFSHGCLSLQGGLRGNIATPQEITLSYWSLNSDNQLLEKVQTFANMDAIVLQHELDHILYGKTYFDHCLLTLNQEALHTLRDIIIKEKRKHLPPQTQQNIISPPFFHYTTTDKTYTVDYPAFSSAIQYCPIQTIDGIEKKLTDALRSFQKTETLHTPPHPKL